MAKEHKRKRTGALRQMRLVAIGTLVVALFTLGVILLFQATAIGIKHDIKENIRFSVELSGDDTQAQYEILKPQLMALSGVRQVEYIDADVAAHELAQQLGESPIDVLGYNPLNSVLRLSLQADYIQPDSLSALEHQMSMLGIDAQLDYKQDLLDSIEANTQRVSWGLWALLLIQVVFAYIQISNTTRLMIYADRLKIRTLTLVGASPWFIRRPIVGRSLIDACIALVLSVGGLMLAIWGVDHVLGVNLYNIIKPIHLLLSLGVLTLVAMLSCAITSWRATLRYIRMDGGKIYLV